MRQIVLEATFETLMRHDWNRTRAADELQISLRTMRNYVHEIRSKGYDVPVGDSGIGARALHKELEEFRTGKRKYTPAQEPYCRKCGRIQDETA
jgi:hypothetical protein